MSLAVTREVVQGNTVWRLSSDNRLSVSSINNEGMVDNKTWFNTNVQRDNGVAVIGDFAYTLFAPNNALVLENQVERDERGNIIGLKTNRSFTFDQYKDCAFGATDKGLVAVKMQRGILYVYTLDTTTGKTIRYSTETYNYKRGTKSEGEQTVCWQFYDWVHGGLSLLISNGNRSLIYYRDGDKYVVGESFDVDIGMDGQCALGITQDKGCGSVALWFQRGPALFCFPVQKDWSLRSVAPIYRGISGDRWVFTTKVNPERRALVMMESKVDGANLVREVNDIGIFHESIFSVPTSPKPKATEVFSILGVIYGTPPISEEKTYGGTPYSSSISLFGGSKSTSQSMVGFETDAKFMGGTNWSAGFMGFVSTTFEVYMGYAIKEKLLYGTTKEVLIDESKTLKSADLRPTEGMIFLWGGRDVKTTLNYMLPTESEKVPYTYGYGDDIGSPIMYLNLATDKKNIETLGEVTPVAFDLATGELRGQDLSYNWTGFTWPDLGLGGKKGSISTHDIKLSAEGAISWWKTYAPSKLTQMGLADEFVKYAGTTMKSNVSIDDYSCKWTSSNDFESTGMVGTGWEMKFPFGKTVGTAGYSWSIKTSDNDSSGIKCSLNGGSAITTGSGFQTKVVYIVPHNIPPSPQTVNKEIPCPKPKWCPTWAYERGNLPWCIFYTVDSGMGVKPKN